MYYTYFLKDERPSVSDDIGNYLKENGIRRVQYGYNSESGVESDVNAFIHGYMKIFYKKHPRVFDMEKMINGAQKRLFK